MRNNVLVARKKNKKPWSPPRVVHRANWQSHRESEKTSINTEINIIWGIKDILLRTLPSSGGLAYTWLMISESWATNHCSGVPSAALCRTTLPEPCGKNTSDKVGFTRLIDFHGKVGPFKEHHYKWMIPNLELRFLISLLHIFDVGQYPNSSTVN